jgi:hypothetical protein
MQQQQQQSAIRQKDEQLVSDEDFSSLFIDLRNGLLRNNSLVAGSEAEVSEAEAAAEQQRSRGGTLMRLVCVGSPAEIHLKIVMFQLFDKRDVLISFFEEDVTDEHYHNRNVKVQIAVGSVNANVHNDDDDDDDIIGNNLGGDDDDTTYPNVTTNSMVVDVTSTLTRGKRQKVVCVFPCIDEVRATYCAHESGPIHTAVRFCFSDIMMAAMKQ